MLINAAETDAENGLWEPRTQRRNHIGFPELVRLSKVEGARRSKVYSNDSRFSSLNT